MADQPFLIERNNQSVRVIVPMRGLYVPVPEWLCHLDFLAVILIPLWYVGSATVRWVFQIKPPPRAVFEIDDENFWMQLCCPRSGEFTTLECPRTAVAEIRKNRYENGLWVHAVGHKMQTYLQDFPDDVIEALGEALTGVLNEPLVTAEV